MPLAGPFAADGGRQEHHQGNTQQGGPEVQFPGPGTQRLGDGVGNGNQGVHLCFLLGATAFIGPGVPEKAASIWAACSSAAWVKGQLVVIIGVVVLGQLPLDGLDALDQQLHLRLGRLPRFRFGNGGQILQFIGIGPGQVQGQLGAGRSDELIQHAGGQNDGLQCLARFAAQGPGAGSRQTDGHARLGGSGPAQEIPDFLSFFVTRQPKKAPAYLPMMRTRKYSTPTTSSGGGADALGGVHQRTQVKIQAGAHEEQQQNGGLK